MEGDGELFQQACQVSALTSVQVPQQPFLVGNVVGQHGIDEVAPVRGKCHGAQAPVACFGLAADESPVLKAGE